MARARKSRIVAVIENGWMELVPPYLVPVVVARTLVGAGSWCWAAGTPPYDLAAAAVAATSMASAVVLATAGYDHKIRFWEASREKCVRMLRYPDSQVNALSITNDKQVRRVRTIGLADANSPPLLGKPKRDVRVWRRMTSCGTGTASMVPWWAAYSVDSHVLHAPCRASRRRSPFADALHRSCFRSTLPPWATRTPGSSRCSRRITTQSSATMPTRFVNCGMAWGVAPSPRKQAWHHLHHHYRNHHRYLPR